VLGAVVRLAVWPGSVPPLVAARSALAEGRAAHAERALIEATRADPADPVPWRLWLELLRLEDRRHDARRVGGEALQAVPPSARREVLAAWTLALLADVPTDMAREALRRFLDADPHDADAQVALLRRIAIDPRPGDPTPAQRVEALEALLADRPGHLGGREALVGAWYDLGEPAHASAVLDAWPTEARDSRYHRLDGRRALEFTRDPARAVAALRRAAADRPDDWTTHFLLARALYASGADSEARAAAETVTRLREVLEPTALGRRLDANLARRDDPAACLDLAALCDRVGLDDLADAWRREARAVVSRPSQSPESDRGR
jgi:thioredoxin-like negative regulator of GroEL